MTCSAPSLRALSFTGAGPGGLELLRALGGKAGPLRQLAALGQPVWPGIVLLPPHGAPARLPRPLLQQLHAALAALPLAGSTLAVRSSAQEEDGTERSFAGQFRTLLHVPPDGLESAILEVWNAAESGHLAQYRSLTSGGTGSDPQPTLPAVLIQPMLPAVVAGVAFSADPVSGRRGVTLIQAVAGVAADLVAGRITGDRYSLDREGRILEHQPQRRGHPLLEPADLRRLSQLVRQLGQILGRPQDVEWALDGEGQLWLLQVRPITGLSRQVDPDGAPGLWDNSNIVESYSGVTTPLTFSFARKAYTEVYQGFCRFMGVREERIQRHRGVFATMIGFHQGRLYYNLLSWYRVLSLLPGYSLNAPCLEQMLGVREPLSPAERERLRLEPPTRPLDDLAAVGFSLASLVGNACGLEERRRAFRRRLDAVLLGPTELESLADARPDELVGHYRRIEAQLLRRWDAPLINDFYAMVVYGLLGGLLRRWRLDGEGRLLQSWISDLGAVISAEPPRRIAAMALPLASDEALISLLERGTLEQIRPALGERPQLQEEISAYLAAFGDRCLGELKLETRTLRDDPLPLLRSLAAAARHGPQRDQSPRPPQPSMPGNPLQRLLLGWLRRRLRRLLSERENLRFERTRVFGQARRILLELGQRLAGLELVERGEDVLFLEVEELLAVVEGTGTCPDLRALANLRRAAWEEQRRAPALPRRFRTRGIPGLDLPAETRAPGESVTAGAEPQEQWQGLGCSAGQVRAAVVRVEDPLQWLQHGRSGNGDRPILVAQATDPGWVLLFPHAAGLLVERGSALSHVAIVAREVGLPMVTELAGISGLLHDGDQVELDGGSGQVRLLRRAADGH
jgi:pyruvate,water dikinase